MENIKKHLEQAEKKLTAKWQEKENLILTEIEQTKGEIMDIATSKNFSQYAILDLKNVTNDKVNETQNLPDLVRIGTLSTTDKSVKMLEIPMLLPFSDNAVSFTLDDNSKNDVHSLFGLTALRFMLSLPLNLSKFYFVDNNLGRDFAMINKVDRKTVDYSIISNQQEMSNLFSDLEDLVSKTYTKLAKSNMPTLKDYNKTAGEMQEPYHFVFISSFPAGFTSETAEKLEKLIKKGNAAKAGVYIFFSIDKNEKPPYGIDIAQISKEATCIYLDSNMNKKQQYKINSSIFEKDFNDRFSITLDTIPSSVEKIIDLINKKTVAKTVVSFDAKYKTMLEKNDFWKGSTADNIKIPIGYVNPKQIQYLEFGKRTNDHFGLIGGLPGMGKTVLLHNIILWGAMEYSPLELNYFLIDCKNGTGFNAYKDLPHTKILSVSNDRGFGVSATTTLIDEMTRRANLFKEASEKYNEQIENVHTYRKKTGEELPRIVAIIDEFQVLFENEDKISRSIREGLDKMFREGRAFGINVILCSQLIGRVDVPIKNITWRLSFKLQDDFESQRILGNDGALQLTKIGNAIVNAHNGEKAHNVNFQVGMMEDVYPYIDALKKAFAEQYPDAKEERFVSDGKNVGRIEKNDILKNNIVKSFKVNDRFCDVYIGEPAFIRNEHAHIRVRKQAGSNIALVGNDIKSAVSIIGLINYQLIRQSSEQSKFYIVDCFNIDNEYSECFDFAKPYFKDQIFIYNSKRIDFVLDEIETELQHRIDKENEGEKVGGRIGLSIAYMQNCRALKKDGYNVSPATKKLSRIIKEGAEYGIHILLYSLTYQGLTEILDTSTLNEFENRIALDSGKSMGVITEQTSTKITEKGMALLQAPEEFTTYNPDLIRVYSLFDIDEKTDDVDFIDKLLKI